jgi:aryl-alcohol dehydrogenase-like predicted oxidoreductase
VEAVRLGSSDLEVSRVGLGCNNFGRRLDREATRAVIDAALEVGVTFLDTADTYGSGESERFIGEVLADRRDDVVLATKFGQDASVPGPGGSREHVRAAIAASLGRLGFDVIDLYYYHRPDGVTPLEETLGAMQELVDEGRVRTLGLSNVDAEQLRQAAASGVTVVAVQNHYSLLRRDDDAEVLPLCRELGIGYIPYFPLASGLLTGKYRSGIPSDSRGAMQSMGFLVKNLTDEAKNAAVAKLEGIAAGLGGSVSQLAIAWAAKNPRVSTVITGASRLAQVQSNLAAAELVDKLTPEVLAKIDELTLPLAE